MSLPAAIEKARLTAEKLKAGSSNEANTKALLIEPLLAALGWDLSDLDQVDREYRVYDGTCLDYALKVDTKPRLFVEAKSLSKKLDDKSFIAQAVNYANNEGVQWCVLTNGVIYRVYKTNEPVGMEQKLLFEADLGDTNAGTESSANELELISRSAVDDGRLDAWGERVFTDSRVRQALAMMGADPPNSLLIEIEEHLEAPKIGPEQLRTSLARILGAAPVATRRSGSSQVPSERKPPRGKVTSDKRQEYPLDHHLAGKPAAIVDMFEQIDKHGQSLGGDVTRRVRKFYIGYFAGSKERSFFTVEVQRQKLYVYLSLDPDATRPWDARTMRDVRSVGHYGMGDTEYVLRDADQLDEVRTLIRLAYERVT